MKKYIVVALVMLLSHTILAQMKGVVWGSDKESKEPIPGAKVRLLNNRSGAVTKEDGTFELILPKNLPDTLIISAFGYVSDSVVVTKKDRFSGIEITLYSDQLLPEVIVAIKRDSKSISRLKTLHVENISSDELKKAACCNLSESFETNASVDVNITDAVSGAKKIQMMGLDGVYTQIQMENIPYLRGLESSFGLGSIPGTWIESMQITKGTGNVVNGYESMAGLVNIELKKPREMERIFLNLYANRFGRTELNFNSGFSLNDKWSSGWLISGAITPVKIDANDDGFLDFPVGPHVSVMNRYDFQGDKMEAKLGFNAYWDDKQGGQSRYDASNPSSFYGVLTTSKHIDVFAKTGFFLEKPLHSIGVVYDFKYHELDARFGNRVFNGVEKRGYVNAIYDGIIGSSTHKFKLGVSGVYSDLKQQMDTLNDDRLEIVPGVFGEYTYSGARLSAVVGVRGDYHNLYGPQVSPRIHLKYALTEYTDLRGTLGKGWRVPNYLIDNVSLLATSRGWVAPDSIRPEISWNTGGSIVQRFKMFGEKASVSVDYYYTQFENQMLVDRDADPNAIVFGNLNGKSYSHSLQAELGFAFNKQWEVRFAYKWLEVRANFGGTLQNKVMVPKHRGLFNINYETRNKRWSYDLTCSVFGKSRLPINQLSDGTLTTQNQSEVYPIVNAQITHVFKKWEFYIGGENLSNSVQRDPIIDAENPFGNTFDATRVWAPVIGMNVYAGVRYSLKQPKRDK